MLPGSGSSADFLRRAFTGPLTAAGLALLALDPPTGSDAVSAGLGLLDDVLADQAVRYVGGVSLGAHLAARWAAARPGLDLDGLLLVLPAWTGEPGPVAALSAEAADRIECDGVSAALAVARSAASGTPAEWVAEELEAAWPAYGDSLATTLRATSRSAGPSLEELARVGVPAVVVAVVDDPMHPVEVARDWVGALPLGVLHTLGLAEVGSSRAALGSAAVTALRAARSKALPPPRP